MHDEIVRSGTCEGSGLADIDTAADCADAMHSTYGVVGADSAVSTESTPGPCGCTFEEIPFSDYGQRTTGNVRYWPPTTCDAVATCDAKVAASAGQLATFDVSVSAISGAKFCGAALSTYDVGNGLVKQVVFAPVDANCVAVFDVSESNLPAWLGSPLTTYTCVDISSNISTAGKFSGAAAAANGEVVFAPQHADCIGVFVPSTGAFSCVDISSTLTGSSKFYGVARGIYGAEIGSFYLAPNDADCIGIFTLSTSSFNCFDISSYSVGGGSGGRFGGVVATGASPTVLVFAPRNSDCVGVYTPSTSSFQCVDISAVLNIDQKFDGAAVAGNGVVVFAPASANCVGVFNPSSNAFSCVNIANPSGSAKFSGAATASNGDVVFAPSSATCVGVFRASTSIFNCIDMSPTITPTPDGKAGFSGVAAKGDRLVFAPLLSDRDGIGIYSLSSLSGCLCKPSGGSGTKMQKWCALPL